jgi:hypothetical protein
MPIHFDMPMSHELTGRFAAGRQAHPVYNVVQAHLESGQQVLTRNARKLPYPVKRRAELPLRESVGTLDLLFFPQLSGILRHLAPTPWRRTVLAGRVRLPLDRTLLRQTARTFEKKLLSFSPA